MENDYYKKQECFNYAVIIEKVKNIQKCFKCSNGLMTIMSASDKLVDVTIFLNNRFTSASMPAY
jgi:hypothetical protein